jgi:hypothetical protein
MKKILACVVIAVGLAPLTAQAQERLFDSGLGAAAGGIAFHSWPGAVAGGVVGYTAGPDIARALGLKGHRYHRYRRHVKR